MAILITGAAGFIGYSLAERLLEQGEKVVGLDNCNNYYDQNLKISRLKRLLSKDNYINFNLDICDENALLNIFKDHDINLVVHLAAQVGVRNSIDNPSEYIKDNIVGFFNVINIANQFRIKHFIYASSSSVYGGCDDMPYKESLNINKPISLYAATKAADELIAYSFSSSYGMQTTGLRFFTVYGPWGRPDMALFKFTKLILEGEALPIYNNGLHLRDFTYIDDVIDGVVAIINKSTCIAQPHKEILNSKMELARVFNLGSNKPVKLLDYINAIEKALNIKAKLNFLPRQPGDVVNTHANIEELFKYVGYYPKYSIENGVKKFVDWYTSYFSAEIKNDQN